MAENRVILGVDSPFAREWLEKKASNAIRSALEFQLETSGLTVDFVVLTHEQKRGLEGRAKRHGHASSGNPQTELALDGHVEPTPPPAPRGRGRRADAPLPIPCLPLNDRFLFDAYVVGKSNRLANAGARSVAKSPGVEYNPLFLYGGAGLGKTHLLQAVANTLKTERPELRVAYVTGEYFAQQYIASVRDHQTEAFRRAYREIDVWLVDDMQFIAGKEHTKEEFFHTFNALHQGKKQVVIASDRSPRELRDMDDRLRTRFQSGLIADVAPPEIETRLAILGQRVQREGLDIPCEVLEYIAGAIQSNIRALDGALTKLVAYSSVMSQAVSLEMAQNVLNEYYIEKAIPRRFLSADAVMEVVAREFGISMEAIKGKGRHKDVALARHVAMYVCRELIPNLNTTDAGAAFGGRDHATILYACQKMRNLIAADAELLGVVKRVMCELKG